MMIHVLQAPLQASFLKVSFSQAVVWPAPSTLVAVLICLAASLATAEASASMDPPTAQDEPVQAQWEVVTATGQPTARHEAALVAFEDKLYLIGGRRINPIDVFDPATNTWTAKSQTPLELHHFQAVVVGDAIYIVGAMTGGWPNEKPVEKVVVYYPREDRFEFVHTIPPARRRGGAGVSVHDGKIYISGGITNGHMDGWQPWLDEYDPKTGQWTPLADAPHARDHLQTAVVGNRLYVTAGRHSSQKTEQGFELTVDPCDVYDFKTERWLPANSCPPIPTPRAGHMATSANGLVLVTGGESGQQIPAHAELEVFDPASLRWLRGPSLNAGRHGTGIAVIGDYVYTASGSGNRGGGPELATVERLPLAALKPSLLPAAQATARPATTGATTEATSNTSSREVVDVEQWHTLTLKFLGPDTSERATPNPFLDYRLQVRFKHESGATQTIRGFYAADGNAAETSAESGNVWLTRFSPDQVGKWTYQATLEQAPEIAIAGNAPFDNARTIKLANDGGSFNVTPSTAVKPDFRGQGRLIVDKGYFRFGSSGPFWIKGGANSPENLLAFADFDGTYRIAAEARDGEAAPTESLHRYAPHVADWRQGDPTWQDGKGKGLIGAINYLSSRGMNSIYFLTMNINGDGKDVWPYLEPASDSNAEPEKFTRFDCSKLDQWEIVFDHMQRQGILIHVVTQETENELLLDGGEMGRLRRLYYQELIARFAHHPALIWNLGEENGPADWSPNGQNAEQQRAMATAFKELDPYQHPVLIHTHSTIKDRNELLPPLLGHPPLDGLSFQVNERVQVHDELIRWRRRAREAGHEWLIAMDEIGQWHTGALTDEADPNHDTLRRFALWGSLLAGGAGVEWYFGGRHPANDLTSEDWRRRDRLWQLTRFATKFFEDHLPFGSMTAHPELTPAGDDYCLAKPGEVYAIYVPARTEQQPIELQLPAGNFSVRWFDPRNGGDLQTGSVRSVAGGVGKASTDVAAAATGKIIDLGWPPAAAEQDWVVLVKLQL